MSAKPLNQDIDSLTSIRGIAAFWIVLFHLSDILFPTLPGLSFLKPLIETGHYAVPLFFILSGYVLGLRYLEKMNRPKPKQLLRFWWLRFGRIYPLHFCTLMVSLLLVARNGWPTTEGHTVTKFIANLLLTHAWAPHFSLSWNYPSWSISSEWFAYLLFPLLATLLGRTRQKAALMFSLIACVVSAGVYVFEDNLLFKGLVVVLPTFAGGVCLAIACPVNQSDSKPLPIADLCTVLVVLLPFFGLPDWLIAVLYLPLFFVIVGTLGLHGNRCSRLWTTRPVVYLGEISYSLYLTHAITITLLTRFVPIGEPEGNSLGVRIAWIIVYLLVILTGSAIVYHTVEKPARTLSRRMNNPGKAV